MAGTTTGTNNNNRNKNYEDLLDFYLLGQDQPIRSTQDETKRLLGERYSSTSSLEDDNKILAVLAQQQTNGRGTQGRKWEGQTGNLYLSIAVPMDRIPVMITLLPLQIGILIAKVGVQPYCSSTKAAAVKWPNDVLVNDRKIAGVLIENWMSPKNHACWLVIGIGINIEYAPELPNGIRPAICLREIIRGGDDDDDSQNNNSVVPSALEIGTNLVHSFLDWIVSENNSNSNKAIREAQILNEWKSLVEFGQIYKIRETGEEVTTLDIQPDGQLKVRGADGKVRLLMADYLH